MVEARTRFLNEGFYAPLLHALIETVREQGKNVHTILDAGCGEGYYTVGVKNAMIERNPDIKTFGIDVSKDAIHAASLRDRSLRLAVASIFDLPVHDESIDLLINLFAPYDKTEFSRVMKSDAVLIRVFPAERHLWELKSAVYDVPYENEIDTFELDGFTQVKKSFLRIPIELESREQIDALFKMTPYYYKTSREGQARLRALDTLSVHAEFYLIVYKKSEKRQI